jgi:hypothetical protein
VSHVIAYGMHAESADPNSSGIHTGVSDASRMYSDVMKRTTIVAREELLDRLHIIRQALEWRAAQARTFQFLAAGESSEPPHDTGRRAGDITFSPRSWR